MKVGSVRIVKPANRMRTVAFPIKSIDPELELAEADDEEDDAVVVYVESVNSFVMPTNVIQNHLHSHC
jgi:hypothetical protein